MSSMSPTDSGSPSPPRSARSSPRGASAAAVRALAGAGGGALLVSLWLDWFAEDEAPGDWTDDGLADPVLVATLGSDDDTLIGGIPWEVVAIDAAWALLCVIGLAGL